MSIAADMTDTEVRELTARLRARDRAIDAGLPPDRPRGDGARRRPLGLAPVRDDVSERDSYSDDMATDGHIILHDGSRFSFKDDMDPGFLASAACNDFVVEMANGCVSISDSVFRAAKKSIAEARTEMREQVARLELQNAEQRAVISELRASLAEVKALAGEAMFVAERLKIERRGPPGHPGPRGVDGPPGPRGERGETGSAGAMIVGWRVDSDRHLCTPIYSDNSAGAPLNLSSFVDDHEDDEEG